MSLSYLEVHYIRRSHTPGIDLLPFSLYDGDPVPICHSIPGVTIHRLPQYCQNLRCQNPMVLQKEDYRR